MALKSAILAFLVLGLYACSNPTNIEETTNTEQDEHPISIESKYEIGVGHVGVFKIGEKVAPKTDSDTYTMRKETHRERRRYQDTFIRLPVTIINDYGEDLFELRYELDTATGKYLETISEIIVLSDKLKTSHGFGIGSTITEIDNAFDDSWVWHSYIRYMYIIESKNTFKGVQFILDKKGTGYEWEPPAYGTVMHELKLEYFMPDTKVIKVRVL